MPRGTKNPEFGERLKELQAKSGLRLSDISRETGVGRATLDNYVKLGRGPEWENAVKLSRFFNVTVDWLLTGEGPKKAASPAPSPPAQPPGEAALDPDKLEEQMLLASYRSAPLAVQSCATELLKHSRHWSDADALELCNSLSNLIRAGPARKAEGGDARQRSA